MFSRSLRSRPSASSATTIARRSLASRAFVYTENGNPSEVLKTREYEVQELTRGQIGLSHKLASINPADINLIEGKYPGRPPRLRLPGMKEADESVIIPGNEGFATVEKVPWGELSKLNPGDWVIFSKPQSGTFQSRSIVGEEDVIKLDRDPEATHPLTELQAAQLYVNPATAYRMLRDFVDLQEGDWIIQNGANSAVGVNVIQLAAAWGIKTVNVVRDRPSDQLTPLKDHLRRLGATEVVTDSEIGDASFKGIINDWTGKQLPKLALNCVSGKLTSTMSKFLSHGATLVTYGAMSKQPLSLPSSYFIFKDLKSVGFWMSRWYQQADVKERDHMLNELVALMEQGKLQAPDAELVPVGEGACDLQEAEHRLKQAIQKTQ